MMTDDQASSIVTEAINTARVKGLSIAVAVVDAAGILQNFRRSGNPFPAAIDLAIAKAKTAAHFRRSTQAMQESLEHGGRTSYLAMMGALPLAGGQPLVVQGLVVGAVGVSGASSADDADIAAVVAMSTARQGDPT